MDTNIAMNPCLRLFAILFIASGSMGVGAELDEIRDSKKSPQPEPARLGWHRQTSVTDFEKVGRHSEAWDATVIGLLEAWAIVRANPDGANEERLRQVTAGVTKAIKAGCDDPLIVYLQLRVAPPPEAKTKAKFAELSAAAARGLSQSRYSDWLKFYGHLRAAEALVQAHAATTDTNETARLWASVGRHRRAAMAHVLAVVRQREAPMEEIYISANEMLDHLANNSTVQNEFCRALEPELEKQDPKNARAWLLKAEFYRSYAWAARGTATADKVPESAWPIFEERLKKAEAAIRRAWDLDPSDVRIPVSAIHTVVGLGDDRAKMEQWFDRAMKLNSNSIAACNAKMRYLEPKWHGSPEAMLAFGRECANSRQWGGQVPLMLAKVHQRLADYLPTAEQSNYWRLPAVWRDIKRSYDVYFARNPTLQARNGQFARYAYSCEQWDAFLSHVELLAKDYREQFFGGAEKFNDMVRVARARSGKSP